MNFQLLVEEVFEIDLQTRVQGAHVLVLGVLKQGEPPKAGDVADVLGCGDPPRRVRVHATAFHNPMHLPRVGIILEGISKHELSKGHILVKADESKAHMQ